MIFNGSAFAKKRLAELQQKRTSFGPLSIGIIVGSADPVISSYVRIKEKNAQALDIELVRYSVSEKDSTDDVLRILKEASSHHGVIVQLPLSPSHDGARVVDAIPLEKDVDVISEKASSLFAKGKHFVMPPVASAINEIIDTYDIQVEGKRAVVVGKGRLVGTPAFHLMSMRGAHVVAVDKQDNLSVHTKNADIIILGAGSPHLLEPRMVQTGVVVFDAGTSESGGMVVGDADPVVAEVASFFTPVPGGIGPVAVIEIFANLLALNARA